MGAQLFYLPFDPVFTSRGLPAGSAKAFFFLSGTTTLAPVYSDATLVGQLANPVSTDALGRLPDIYLDSTKTYRVRVVDFLGAQIGDDVDPYIPGTARMGPPGIPGPPDPTNVLDCGPWEPDAPIVSSGHWGANASRRVLPNATRDEIADVVLLDGEIAVVGGKPWFGDGVTPGGISHRATDDGKTFNRAVFDRLRDDAVSIMDCYLPTDPDFTAAAQRALDTGRNVFLPKREGGYHLHDGITMAAAGQRIFSHGAYSGFFHVGTDFNMSAPGVLNIDYSASERQAGLADVGFLFDQPQGATTRSQLVQYPWAINAPGVSRMQFDGVVRIVNAWNGVNFDAVRSGTVLVSNCGGLKIDQLEICAFNRAYILDGIADSVHIGMIKCWPFYDALSLPLRNLYHTPGLLGGYIGRVDGLSVENLHHFWTPLQVPGTDASGEAMFGTIGALHLDGDRSAMTFGGGVLRVASGYMTTSLPLEQKIFQTGGKLSWDKPWLLGPGVSGSVPIIQLNGGLMQIHGASIDALGLGQSVVQQAGGRLEWIGGEINTYPDLAYTAPLFDVLSGRTTIKNPRFGDKGAGSGTALRITTDDWHDIEMNALVGWARSAPTATLASYKFGSTILGAAR